MVAGAFAPRSDLGYDRGTEFAGATPEVLVQTAVLGALAYVALVAMLRISGKRTLSQLNAFDFVVADTDGPGT